MSYEYLTPHARQCRADEIQAEREEAVWNQHPEARDTIEKATGAWLVFGQDVETGGVSAQRVTQGKDHIEQPLEMLAAPGVLSEPNAWAAVHFSGKQAGKIYTTRDTKEQIEAYIHQVHQSNDSITLRAEPIYMRAAPQQQEDALDAELLDWLEGEVCDSYTGVTITRVDHREDGMVIERGFRLRRFHKDYEVKPTLRAAIAAAKEKA